MVRVYYSPQYVGSAHAFDTTRKSKWIADSLVERPIAGIEIVEPPPLDRGLLESVHDPAYVHAVETGTPRHRAESQGFTWDQGLWSMVLASNGGAVAAALTALQDGIAGSLSSGLHHARRESGAGFCTFNGLAIAAKAAIAAGVRSVLILDLDAHFGGGTASLIAVEPSIRHIDVSVNSYDGYDGTEQSRPELVTEASEYLPTVRKVLSYAEEPEFGLCIYNAGMDPFDSWSSGVKHGITREILAERERIVFEWCRMRGLPVAFVLAGGYLGSRLDKAGLVDLHRLTLEAASRHL